MGRLTLRAWRVQPGRFGVPANAGAGVDGEADGLHAKGQRFFKGHDQAVSALALCEGERMVALGPGARAAALSEGNTGETRDDGAQAAGLGPEALREAVPQRRGRAYVCVWDTRELRELARIGYYREGFGGRRAPGVPHKRPPALALRVGLAAGVAAHRGGHPAGPRRLCGLQPLCACMLVRAALARLRPRWGLR